MKVVCIDAATRIQDCDLIEGQVYTADPSDQCHEGCCFMIIESSCKWSKDRFVPLSDLDETTLVNEEFEEKYCVPVNR